MGKYFDSRWSWALFNWNWLRKFLSQVASNPLEVCVLLFELETFHKATVILSHCHLSVIIKNNQFQNVSLQVVLPCSLFLTVIYWTVNK